MRLSTKLIVLFLAIGVLPALLIGAVALVTAEKDMRDGRKVTFGTLSAAREIKKRQIERYFQERRRDMQVLVDTVATLRRESVKKLEAVRDTKKASIERYFEERYSNIDVLANSAVLQDALHAFTQAFESEDLRTGGPLWTAADKKYGKWLTYFKERYGYYDLFLISPKGDVVYTVARESDLGEDLRTGFLKTSALGNCFARCKDGVYLADFAPYGPSNNESASFIGKTVLSRGKVQGVVALQMPIDGINAIMTERSGMGETGESYLVGDDYLLRSDSPLSNRHNTVAASFAEPVKGAVRTEAVKAALRGETGADVVTTRDGTPVLSAYAPLKVGNLSWAILAEINVAESFSPRNTNGVHFYDTYAKTHGYHDLFLLNPDGYCFFTVAHEGDEKTNLLTGKYKDSGLGRLIRRVLQKGSYALEDFAPYEPSGGRPAAFVAQPLAHGTEVELIVALQLPIEAIDEIMGSRAGMGETGESYLVGSDGRMRSASFLDPTGRSVEASFAGTVEKNGVETEATREAFAGKTGSSILQSYNGCSVLSVYTPVQVGEGTTWGLIAEVKESEAYAGLIRLRGIMGLIGGLALCLIIFASVRSAKHVKRMQDRLAVAERMESLGLLAGGVAHDLNNQLGPIMALPEMVAADISEWLPEGNDTAAEVVKSLKVIQKCATRAADTVSDLLVLGRRNTAKYEICDVNQIDGFVRGDHCFAALRKKQPDVKIDVQPWPEPLKIMGSLAQLSRVLHNLVFNAVEAIEGPGKVCVRLYPEVLDRGIAGFEIVPAGSYAVLEVSDTGIGISPDKIRNVFEPFFTTKRHNQQSGSGLGLSVVHGIVRDHKGFFDISSRPGKGTTFTIYLPAIEQRDESA